MKYRDNKRPGVLYTRNFILRSLCGIYLMAFVSFYYQSEGVYSLKLTLDRHIPFPPSTDLVTRHHLNHPSHTLPFN